MNNKNQNNLAKGVLIYGIGTFGTKILSFLIVPLYTYYISTSDMGVYDILIATIGLLTPLVTLQISDAAYKWILQNERVEDHIRSTLQVLLLNCTIACCVILFVSGIVVIPYSKYFAAVLVLSRILETSQKLLRGLRRQKLFVISGLVYTIVFLSLNVLLIVHLKIGVVGLFQSAVIANSVAILTIYISEPRLRKNPFQRIDYKLVKKMLSFSIPLIPNYMNWWVINSSDKYIVNFFLGFSANGILAIAHKFPTILQTVLGLFNNSWQDVSIATIEKDEQYNTRVFRRFSLFALGLLLPLIPATKIVINLVMNSDYKASRDLVAFYYIGIVFQAFSSFYGVGYLKSDNTKKAFSTSVFGAIVNAASNIILIQFIGMQAAAISTFLGFFSMWIIRERQNRQELGIEVKWMEILTLTGLSIILAILSIIFNTKINAALFILGLALFLLINRKLIFGIIKKAKNSI